MGAGESVLISPGEMYWADLATGRRPVVVVSREDLNRGNYVVAVLCTTVNFAVRSTLSNCVPLRAGEFGLPQDCVAQCEAITFVDKQDLDIQAGSLALWTMYECARSFTRSATFSTRIASQTNRCRDCLPVSGHTPFRHDRLALGESSFRFFSIFARKQWATCKEGSPRIPLRVAPVVAARPWQSRGSIRVSVAQRRRFLRDALALCQLPAPLG